MSNIVKLLSELGSDASLQQDYKKDPAAVMSRYDLTEDETAAMSSNDVDILKKITNQANIAMFDSIVQAYK